MHNKTCTFLLIRFFIYIYLIEVNIPHWTVHLMSSARRAPYSHLPLHKRLLKFFSTASTLRLAITAYLVRVLLVCYAQYHDTHFPIKYTDIDHAVMRDGAAAMWSGIQHFETLDACEQAVREAATQSTREQQKLASIKQALLETKRTSLQHAQKYDAKIERIDAGSYHYFVQPCITIPSLKWFVESSPESLPFSASSSFRIGTPFDRATYRYTPWLSLLWLPDVIFETNWMARVFFLCFADVAVGVLIMSYLTKISHQSHLDTNDSAAGHISEATAKLLVSVCLWFNPIVVNVSTRGNCDMLVNFFVFTAIFTFMASMDCVHGQRKNDYLANRNRHDRTDAFPSSFYHTVLMMLTGVILGVAIHVKIYPVIFAPAFALSVFMTAVNYNGYVPHASSADDRSATSSSPNASKASVRFGTRLKWVLQQAAAAVAGGVIGAGLPTLAAYLLWGDWYLDEAILYHIGRVDHRHNLAPHFYPMYLEMARPFACGFAPMIESGGLSVSSKSSSSSSFVPALAEKLGVTFPPLEFCRRNESYGLGFLSFIPQLMTVLLVTIRLRSDIAQSVSITTMVFVCFNKVCTVQYFVWFIPLLPFIFCHDETLQGFVSTALLGLPGDKISSHSITATTTVLPSTPVKSSRSTWYLLAFAVFLWIGSLAGWGFFAAALEFDGKQTFFPLWIMACCHFFGLCATTAAVARAAVSSQHRRYWPSAAKQEKKRK